MAVAAFFANCGACVVMSLPPPIAPDDAEPLPLRVTTDTQHIADGLNRANVFAEVVHVEGKHAATATAPAADLRLTAKWAGDSNGPPIPVITMLTLGLVPTIVVEDAGWELTLSSTDRPGETVTCRYVYTRTAVVGLLGTLLSLDRVHYTTESPTSHPRFFDHLERNIRDQAPALLVAAGYSSPISGAPHAAAAAAANREPAQADPARGH